MNPLTNMKNVLKLSEQELNNKYKTSWHDQYKDSAWIFVGGLPYDLSEGDIICIFSQYGEIVNINLIRDKDTGKSKGFCFVCYEDQRSTVLAVDNFNGIKVLNRTIRVDHVAGYKAPKEGKKTDEVTKKLYSEGCAPQLETAPVKKKSPPRDVRETIGNQIEADIKLPMRLPIYIKEEKVDENPIKMEETSDQEVEKATSSKRKKTNKKKHEYDSTDDESRKSKSHKKSKKHHKHDHKKNKKDHYRNSD